MTPSVVAARIAIALIATAGASAAATGLPPSPGPIVLVDSTGKTVARPLNETIVLVSLASGVAAPALIRPVYGADGRAASGVATWQSGGSVLFTSADCTTGAHVYASTHAGVRATAQVQTPAGINLHVGEVGPATTATIQSILYDTGCTQVAVRQNGLLPVVSSVNLSTAYPPPLAFQ